MYDKTCSYCGKAFLAKGARAKYCSSLCQEEGKREWRREYRKIQKAKEAEMQRHKHKGLDNALKELGCRGYIERQKQDTINKYARVII